MIRALAVVLSVLALPLSSWSNAQDTQSKWEFPQDWFWHSDDGQRAKHAALLGKPMPALDVAKWKNGEIKPDDLKGKVVVLDFWATWCGPCIAAIPHTNEMAEKYKDKGVIVIGVCTSSRGQETYEKAVEQHGIKYHSAADPELKSQKAWQVMWYPTYAVVDRKGVVRAIGLKPDFVEKVVEKLVAEPGTAAGDDAVIYAMAGGADKPEWREDSQARKDLDAMEGKAPPALQVTNWINSEGMKLADLKGKVVLLDFWATWCGPCIAAIPHTNELADKHRDKGLVIIGVCHPRDVEKMSDTVKDKGIRYPVAADPEGKTIAAFKVTSYPDYYLIDRAGNLRIADCKNASVDEAVEALLAESATAAMSDAR
jgi:thiol-disulfide isomerase/thioredoxin